MIIDTHCHIDHYSNPLDVISKTNGRDILIIAMTNLPSYFQQGIKYLGREKRIIQALGMHPMMLSKHEEEFNLFEQLVQGTSWIGEIGADGSKDGINTLKDQLVSLKRILRAAGKNKIFSLHSRGAEADVLSMARECGIQKAIFHWYSGNKMTLRQIIDSGYYLSINPSMCYSKSGKSIISEIPTNLLLTESDGPFSSLNNAPYYPWDVTKVIEYIAKERSMAEEEVEQTLWNNFRQLCDGVPNSMKD